MIMVPYFHNHRNPTASYSTWWLMRVAYLQYSILPHPWYFPSISFIYKKIPSPLRYPRSKLLLRLSATRFERSEIWGARTRRFLCRHRPECDCHIHPANGSPLGSKVRDERLWIECSRICITVNITKKRVDTTYTTIKKTNSGHV